MIQLEVDEQLGSEQAKNTEKHNENDSGYNA
jgi:hypothetical protein